MTTKKIEYSPLLHEYFELFERAVKSHILITKNTKRRNNDKPILCARMVNAKRLYRIKKNDY